MKNKTLVIVVVIFILTYIIFYKLNKDLWLGINKGEASPYESLIKAKMDVVSNDAATMTAIRALMNTAEYKNTSLSDMVRTEAILQLKREKKIPQTHSKI